MALSQRTRKRLAIVLADLLGEEDAVARDVADYFNVYLARLPSLSRLGILAIVWAVLWLPFLLVGRPLPADALAPETRVRYLRKWANARSYYLREGFFLVKAIALFGWGQHPIVRARIGVGPLQATRGAA